MMKQAEKEDKLAKEKLRREEQEREEEFRRIMMKKYEEEKQLENLQLEERRLKELKHRNQVKKIILFFRSKNFGRRELSSTRLPVSTRGTR